MALLPRGAWSSISTGPLKLTFCKGEQGAWHRLSDDGRGGHLRILVYTTTTTTRIQEFRGFPKSTGVHFNDTYRYMDWFPTAHLPLIETIVVTK